MNFEQTKEFQKELKQFSKKYKSLHQDLLRFQKLVEALELPEMQHFFEGNRATKLSIGENYEVVKARLDCAVLGSKQLMRIIYIIFNNQVLFIELFAKNVKPREDVLRIKRYLQELK